MYGKHYDSMYTGSMLGAGAVVFAVWGYVIAHVKPPGFELELNPMMLAFILGEPEEKVVQAIERLCSPDPKSRSKEEEGRKMIRRGQYLYFVVNGEHYHRLRVDEDVRAYWRQAKQMKLIKDVDKTKKSLDPAPASACIAMTRNSGVKIPDSLAASVDFLLWWNNWLGHLKGKKSSPSVHAQQLQLAKLEAMGLSRAVAALKHSIESNWKGIYEKTGNNGQAPASLPGLDQNNASDMRNYL